MSKNTISQKNLSDLTSQVRSLTTQLNALKSQFKSIKAVPIPSKTTFAHEREEGLKDKYADYRDNILADYIYGLYHPDVVFKECLDIKSPSYMPVPTTSFKFKETFTIKPNTLGNFVLFWSPNFLGTSSELTRIHRPSQDISPADYMTQFPLCLVNSNSNLDGNTSLLNGWYGINFKHVQQDFEKYRLTSACIKVKYTGKVIDQSGMLAACASYVKARRLTISTPVTGEAVGSFEVPISETRQLSAFCDFDTIRQGQWADTCSVVTDPDGITCTYVPTDPLNQVFVDNATTIDAIDHSTSWDGTRFISSWSPTNANISYVICGYGINPGTSLSCITVEAYYNFEIIVRQEQYPYFNPRTVSTKILNAREDIRRVADAVAGNGLVSHTKTHDNPSVWTKVRGAFSKAGKVMMDVLPYVKPLIKAMV
jgi:hypothetical protein